jgi:hypothetical protein
MYALELQRNGQPLVVAGVEDAALLSFAIHVDINGEHPATLDMRGMRELGNERQAHLEWIQQFPLVLGDEIGVMLLEVEEATPPTEEFAADSDEYIAGQAAYEAQLASGPPEAPSLERKQPDASLEVLVSDAPVVATFESGREMLTMRVDWNRWRPERCRLSLRSFSVKEGLARAEGKNWLTETAAKGQAVIVRVGAGHT